MADRYWVGGSGTWNATSTTNWSTASGQAGGASVPTASDNVIIDANSGSTKSLVMSGATLTCLNFSITTTGWSLANSSTYTLTVSGDFFIASGNSTSGTGLACDIIFASSSIQTLTTNGISFNARLYINGIGSGGLQLVGSLLQGTTSATAGVTLNSGTFNTNNYNVTTSRTILKSPGTATRSLILGTSTITGYYSWDLSSTTGLTFSGASSTIYITSGDFLGGSQTYGNVTLDPKGSHIDITGANTFNNLNIISNNSSSSTDLIVLYSNQVITGTLSFPKSTATSGNYRYQFKSSVRGVARTITAAAIDATTLSNIDFQDITAAGVSAPWPGSSGINIGDAGGNTNITFRAGRTVFFNNSTTDADGFGGGSSSPHWALTSGGTPSAANFPLAQDSIVIDNNSAMGIPENGTWTNIGWRIYNGDYFINNVTFTKTATWEIGYFGSNGLFILGNLSITGGMIQHGTDPTEFNFDGTVAQTISINPTTPYSPGELILYLRGLGSYNIVANTSIVNSYIYHTGGTLDVSSGLTCYFFSSSSNLTRTLSFGTTGTITTTVSWASVSIDIGTTKGLTITGTYSQSSFLFFNGGTLTSYGGLNFNTSNSDYTTIDDFAALSFDLNLNTNTYNAYGGHYKNVTIGADKRAWGSFPLKILGNLTMGSGAQATQAGSALYLRSNSARTITNGGNTHLGAWYFESDAGLGSWTMQDAYINNSSSSYSGSVILSGGTINLNGFAMTIRDISSTGIITRSITTNVATTISLTGTPTSPYDGVLLDFSDPTNLTLSSNITFKPSATISSGVRSLLSGAFVEGNAPSISSAAGTGTYILLGGTNPAWNNLNFTGYSGAFTLAADTKLYGSLTIPSAAGTMNGTSYTLTFSGTSGTKTIASGANLIDIGALTFDGGATYQLSAALTCGTLCGVTLTLGTLNLNGFNLTCETIASSNSNVRTLAFGTTGSITCTDITGTTVNFNTSTNLTVTGTAPLITLSQTATTVGRTVYMPAVGESSAISLTITGGSDAITIRGTSGAYNNLTFSSFTGSMTTANSPIIYGNLTMPATMTTVASTTTLTFGATSGTKTISTNGITIDFPVTLSGVNGTFQLSSALTLESTRTLTLTSGTFDSNSFDVTTGLFSSSNSNTRSIAFGASQWTITGSGTAWNTATSTQLNTSSNQYIATISMTSASAKTFAGGGSYWPILDQGGVGVLTITGNNNFTKLQRSINGNTIALPSSGTTTVESFSLSGVSGNLNILKSSTDGIQATLAYTGSSRIFQEYMNIKDINFTPATYLTISNSFNSGNNSGIGGFAGGNSSLLLFFQNL